MKSSDSNPLSHQRSELKRPSGPNNFSFSKENKIDNTLSGVSISEKVSSVINFYGQLKSPYFSSQHIMKQKLQEHTAQLRLFSKEILRQGTEPSLTDGRTGFFSYLKHSLTSALQKASASAKASGINRSSPSELSAKAARCQSEINDLKAGLIWSAAKIKELDEEMQNKISIVTSNHNAAAKFQNMGSGLRKA